MEFFAICFMLLAFTALAKGNERLRRAVPQTRTFNRDSSFSRWPDPSKVYYYIDVNAYSVTEQTYIRDAMNQFTLDMQNCIVFVPTTPSDTTNFKVKITPYTTGVNGNQVLQTVCSSYPGVSNYYVNSGSKEQEMIITRGQYGCLDGTKRSIMKYLAILMQKRNEHQRGDRETYIAVDTTKLVSSYVNAYRLFNESEAYWQTNPYYENKYDYCSITHNQPGDYAVTAGSPGFSIRSGPNAIPKWEHLSTLDCLVLSRVVYRDQCSTIPCTVYDCDAARAAAASATTSTTTSTTTTSTTTARTPTSTSTRPTSTSTLPTTTRTVTTSTTTPTTTRTTTPTTITTTTTPATTTTTRTTTSTTTTTPATTTTRPTTSTTTTPTTTTTTPTTTTTTPTTTSTTTTTPTTTTTTPTTSTTTTTTTTPTTTITTPTTTTTTPTTTSTTTTTPTTTTTTPTTSTTTTTTTTPTTTTTTPTTTTTTPTTTSTTTTTPTTTTTTPTTSTTTTTTTTPTTTTTTPTTTTTTPSTTSTTTTTPTTSTTTPTTTSTTTTTTPTTTTTTPTTTSTTTTSTTTAPCPLSRFCTTAPDESGWYTGPYSQSQTAVLYSGPCQLQYTIDFITGKINPTSAPALISTFTGTTTASPLDLAYISAFDPTLGTMTTSLLNKAVSQEVKCNPQYDADGIPIAPICTASAPATFPPAAYPTISSQTDNFPDFTNIAHITVDGTQTNFGYWDTTFSTQYYAESGSNTLNQQSLIKKITAIQYVQDMIFFSGDKIAVFGVGADGVTPYVGYLDSNGIPAVLPPVPADLGALTWNPAAPVLLKDAITGCT